MTSLSPGKLARLGIGALVLAAAVVPAKTASAVGTRTFQLDTIDELKGGDLTGVSVDSNGNVRAGLTLGSLPVQDASSVWSSVVLPDGSVLLGTGSDGKIFKVSGGKATLVATTGAMAVSSMVVAWNGDVIAGTFPDGKLYRLPAGGGNGGPAAAFGDLPGAEDVWALAFDAKSKSLYAATGPEGKVFRVDQAGKSQVHFDSDEAHIVSLAVADDGTVYAGSNGKGLLYKITGPGRATVAYDFDADEVKAIAFGKNGSMFVVANKMGESFAPPKRNRTGPAGPQSTRPSKPGKGMLYRFGKDGIAEQLLTDNEAHYVSLAIDDAGAPYVGTGAEGRLYTVDEAHVASLVADTDERQIGAVVVSGKQRFLATTDPVVFREIKGTGGADAVWTSKVLDAGLRATFGRLAWRSEGQLELSTRSGNTETPDATWSAWSAGLGAPGDVQSPPGRYVQIRARWSRDPKAVLREVTLYFVTDNARAVITSIDATAKNSGSKSGKMGIVSSGGESPRPSSSVKLSWRVDNPDQDDLRYRVSYRLEGQNTWRSVQKPGEKLTRPELDWDTTGLPEGPYRILVEATDELSNPPDRVQKHSLESATVLVDNTPPVYKALAMQGRKLKGEVVDGLGPIARIEVSIAGSDEWRPLFPSDGVLDEPSEAFDVDIASIVPPGAHIVAVRVYDSAGNVVTRDVEAK
ncbi:hypothetical protein [Polyangium sp. 15x6]|uniref:hypothetical protein n=1 Tax=Polyangium sp. 15x6 TaxID=3042687 RepID=UPI00249BA484|nr:hypothetical protein [Polyangium sp. 15x6]MDI3284679.1 hypothetical protein [Polyangium sp. 15x6]